MSRPLITEWNGILFKRQLNDVLDWLEVEVMSDIAHAEREVLSTYGDTVSVEDKAKSLNKFGRNRTVGTTWETVAVLQGTTANETFVSTDLIDSIVSDSAADTGITFVIEGHTIDASGNLTFVTQEATLDGSDGRTEVTLSTPMARANRMYVKASGTFNSPQTGPAGNVYVYDNTAGITAGVPNTAAATKLMITAGEVQTEKAATSISSSDYWFVRYLTAGVGDSGASANYITIRLETRDVANGGVWRPKGLDIVLLPAQVGKDLEFSPMLIVPKNHDIRVRAQTDTNTAEIYAEVGGYLASVTE